MTSELDVLLYDITGKIHGYTNEDYPPNEISDDTQHSHVFQNMPGTDDYEPVYVYGLNTKYLQQLLRLQCEKPIVFTSDMHDKQVIYQPGQEVCVQNTGPYPIRNSGRITVVPPLTSIYCKLSDKQKTLLQTVEWEIYNKNLWDMIVFLQSLLTTTMNIKLDMDLINDAYWDILAKRYDEERHKSNYLLQEIHFALEKHFPLSHSREKIKTIVKFIRDYWIETNLISTNVEDNQMVLPLMINPDILTRLYLGLNNLLVNSGEINAGVQGMLNEASVQQIALSGKDFLLQPIYKYVDESIKFTSTFSNILLLLLQRFKIFKTIQIADVISASSEYIYQGGEMIVKLCYT
jgi:hypothetical protein